MEKKDDLTRSSRITKVAVHTVAPPIFSPLPVPTGELPEILLHITAENKLCTCDYFRSWLLSTWRRVAERPEESPK